MRTLMILALLGLFGCSSNTLEKKLVEKERENQVLKKALADLVM